MEHHDDVQVDSYPQIVAVDPDRGTAPLETAPRGVQRYYHTI